MSDRKEEAAQRYFQENLDFLVEKYEGKAVAIDGKSVVDFAGDKCELFIRHPVGMPTVFVYKVPSKEQYEKLR